MKQKSYEEHIRKHINKIMKDSDYAWDGSFRRDTLLCCIAVELGKIVDILEERNGRAK